MVAATFLPAALLADVIEQDPAANADKLKRVDSILVDRLGVMVTIDDNQVIAVGRQSIVLTTSYLRQLSLAWAMDDRDLIHPRFQVVLRVDHALVARTLRKFIFCRPRINGHETTVRVREDVLQ